MAWCKSIYDVSNHYHFRAATIQIEVFRSRHAMCESIKPKNAHLKESKIIRKRNTHIHTHKIQEIYCLLCEPMYSIEIRMQILREEKNPFELHNAHTVTIKKLWWIFWSLKKRQRHFSMLLCCTATAWSTLVHFNWFFPCMRVPSLSARILKLFCFGRWCDVTICLCMCKCFLCVLILRNVYINLLCIS